ncbi:Hypothetical protein ABZS17G119_00269 [Kosakonia cowanii]
MVIQILSIHYQLAAVCPHQATNMPAFLSNENSIHFFIRQ